MFPSPLLSISILQCASVIFSLTMPANNLALNRCHKKTNLIIWYESVFCLLLLVFTLFTSNPISFLCSASYSVSFLFQDS